MKSGAKYFSVRLGNFGKAIKRSNFQLLLIAAESSRAAILKHFTTSFFPGNMLTRKNIEKLIIGRNQFRPGLRFRFISNIKFTEETLSLRCFTEIGWIYRIIKKGFSASNQYYLACCLKEMDKMEECVEVLRSAVSLPVWNDIDRKVSNAYALMTLMKMSVTLEALF